MTTNSHLNGSLLVLIRLLVGLIKEGVTSSSVTRLHLVASFRGVLVSGRITTAEHGLDLDTGPPAGPATRLLIRPKPEV